MWVLRRWGWQRCRYRRSRWGSKQSGLRCRGSRWRRRCSRREGRRHWRRHCSLLGSIAVGGVRRNWNHQVRSVGGSRWCWNKFGLMPVRRVRGSRGGPRWIAEMRAGMRLLRSAFLAWTMNALNSFSSKLRPHQVAAILRAAQCWVL